MSLATVPHALQHNLSFINLATHLHFTQPTKFNATHETHLILSKLLKSLDILAILSNPLSLSFTQEKQIIFFFFTFLVHYTKYNTAHRLCIKCCVNVCLLCIPIDVTGGGGESESEHKMSKKNSQFL